MKRFYLRGSDRLDLGFVLLDDLESLLRLDVSPIRQEGRSVLDWIRLSRGIARASVDHNIVANPRGNTERSDASVQQERRDSPK